MAPFRAWHANTRHGPVPAKLRRRASRAKPCPTPQPRPGGSTGGPRATRQHQDHRLPGEREPRRSAVMPPRRRQTQPHQAGAVGSGRAGCARRGGNRGDRAQPRRVLACPALNGATAAAWPLRGLACDKRWGSPSPIRQPLRLNARFQAVPQSQLRAANSRCADTGPRRRQVQHSTMVTDSPPRAASWCWLILLETVSRRVLMWTLRALTLRAGRVWRPSSTGPAGGLHRA